MELGAFDRIDQQAGFSLTVGYAVEPFARRTGHAAGIDQIAVGVLHLLQQEALLIV